MTSPQAAVFITGFPGFVAQRLAAFYLHSEAETEVRMLVHDADAVAARAFVQSQPPSQQRRITAILGDIRAIDLGMSGSDFRHAAQETTCIHHLAGLQDVDVDATKARQINVEGTRNLMDFASGCQRLARICHWSTAQVAGRRKGVVLEDELRAGQSFHSPYEQTRYEAEVLAEEAKGRLPLTVLRPTVIVGDSQTGEIDRLDGPYYLMLLIANNVTHVHVPLPGRGDAPLHLVPVDFVIRAAHALAHLPAAKGGTFHLCDPNPLSARRVYELVAERAHTALPRGFVLGSVARTLLRAPGLERLARAPRAFIDAFDHQVFYNSRKAHALLATAGIHCPSFDTYVDALLDYVRQLRDQRRQSDLALEDRDPYD